MHRSWIALALIALVGCGSESSSGTSSGDESFDRDPGGSLGDFRVEDSFGAAFDESSTGARIGWARASMIDLRADGYRISIDARNLPETGPGVTTELGFNNTTWSRSLDVDGRATSVSCKPGDPEQGRFERTSLSDAGISGSFEVEFVRCTHGMTGQAVEVDGLPVTVIGTFEDLPLND